MPSDRAWSTERSSTSSPRMRIRPASGFWKPEMILINVDLPAPLSPSRPRTSPLRRCRSTSRSAVTGPKRLATPSTRRTSSLVSRSSATSAALSHPSDVDVDDHRDEDRDAEDEVEVVGADALDGQAVAQDAEEQRAEQRPDRGALAAGQQRAADDRGRHGAEHRLRRAGGVGRDRAGAGGLEDADQAGQRAAHHEVADDDRADLDAGLAGAVLVAAGSDRVQAPPRHAQDDLDAQHDDQRPDQLRVDAGPEDPGERPHVVD